MLHPVAAVEDNLSPSLLYPSALRRSSWGVVGGDVSTPLRFLVVSKGSEDTFQKRSGRSKGAFAQSCTWLAHTRQKVFAIQLLSK